MISSPASSPASHGSDPFTDELLDLPCLALRCGDSTAAIAQQGAQVLSWRDAHGRERLYLSPETGGAKRDAVITSATMPPAIRGGMPVCFPQFSGRGPLPKHGFARAMRWTADEVSGHSFPAQNSVASFTLQDDNCTQVIWPEAFLAQLQVLLEPDRLSVTLTLTNRGNTPWSFTGALHTYLRVRDIGHTALSGLQDTRYQDATNNNQEVLEREPLIKVNGEIDRVYLSPPKSLQLIEDGRPSLRIEQTGFEDTVVWNPGPVLIRSLKDFPDEDWRHMLCVEAACASKPVLLQPGSTWVGSQILHAV
jgi:glucose-6-phosphate 1-epimerase